MTKDDTPHLRDRELIGKVTTSFGAVEVYAPRVQDFLEAGGSADNPETIFKLAATCCNTPYISFMSWNLEDGMKVLELVGKSLQGMSDYLRRQ